MISDAGEAMPHRRRETSVSCSSIFAFALLLSAFHFCFLLFNHGEEYEISMKVSHGSGLARSKLMLYIDKITDASLLSPGSDPSSVSNRRSTPLQSLRSPSRASPPRDLWLLHTYLACSSGCR